MQGMTGAEKAVSSAKVEKLRAWVVIPGKEWKVRSRSLSAAEGRTVFRRVKLESGFLRCECPGAIYHGPCVHTGAVARRIARALARVRY